VVFSGRVVGDFRWFGIFKRVTRTPFAWWNTWIYIPLCVLLRARGAARGVAGTLN